MCSVPQLCLTLCDPMDCSPPGSSVHENSPGKNTGVGCHALLQWIFPAQGSNPCLPPCRQILYCLSYLPHTCWMQGPLGPALTGSCGFVLCSGDSVPGQSMTALRTLALDLRYHSPCCVSLQVGACVPVCTWCYWTWAVIFNELFKEYLRSPCLRLDIILCVRAEVVKKASKSHSLESVLEGGLKPNPFVLYCSVFISDPKRSYLAGMYHGDTK